MRMQRLVSHLRKEQAQEPSGSQPIRQLLLEPRPHPDLEQRQLLVVVLDPQL